MEALPRLYRDLAEWWPLLSAPAEYEEEAAEYARLILGAVPDAREVLELGSGGGNNASHMKASFELTLVDLSPAMLEVSRRLNPECEHVEGDMRSVRLGRTFDAVFVHDAIAYMTTEEDLRAGVRDRVRALPAGRRRAVRARRRDRDVRAGDRPRRPRRRRPRLRYLEWTWDPDPDDTTCRMDLTYVLHEPDGSCTSSSTSTSAGCSGAPRGSG